MRSSLASRNVCRRLLVSHGLFSPASALAGLSHAALLRPTRPRRALAQPSSHRTFLGFLRAKPPREIKHVGFEPGVETFLAFRANTADNVKPPSDEELVEAFRKFFRHKLSLEKPVNPTQALLACQVVEHLRLNSPKSHEASQAVDGETETRKPWLGRGILRRDKRQDAIKPFLTRADLRTALKVLMAKHRQGPSEAVADLATSIYNELEALRISLKRRESGAYVLNIHDYLVTFISILTDHGQTLRAEAIVSQIQTQCELLEGIHKTIQQNRLRSLHNTVLRGYGREGDYYRLRLYAQMLLDANYPYTVDFQKEMTRAYSLMGEDGEEGLREWFERPIQKSNSQTDHISEMNSITKTMPGWRTYLYLVNFSQKAGRQPEWIKTALQKLCDMNPPKRWWDVIFTWAVAQGKDIGRIRNMVDVVEQVNPGDESCRVDICTINGMLKAAMASNQLFLAERINSLASELGLRPDIDTHMTLLRARIAGQDKLGAASTFEDLIHSGPVSPGSEVNDVLNLYIRFVSASADSATLIETLSRVEARHGELEPETVVHVCMKFFKDDKTMEVVDTLGLHLSQFSMEERRVVRDDFVQYCLDMTISTARAWDAYSLMRQYWPETTKEERTKLMQAFFSRKRPDMACHVFGHMRAHPDNSVRPDSDTYVLCLENLGAYPDRDSLAMVHNMFKMDALIQPSTRLYNAFIIAHSGCGESARAFEFWRQIANSKAGPTYKSLELVFRACQKLPYGYDRATTIWDKMQSLEVDVPVNVYDAFTLMVAGQGRLDKTLDMLLARATEHNKEPSQMLSVYSHSRGIRPIHPLEADPRCSLSRIFNAIPYAQLQDSYSNWVALEFPDKWQKIQKLRKSKTLQGIDRIWLPPERVRAE